MFDHNMGMSEELQPEATGEDTCINSVGYGSLQK